MKTQVSRNHYNFGEYVDWRRWLSYYFQIDEAIKSECNSFLIIGKGDGIVPEMIKKFSDGRVVDTYDYDEMLEPTYCGDIRDIDRINMKYECVLCCQVLEHLEFDQFEKVITKIKRICTKRLILSLPVRNTEVSIYADIPKTNKIKEFRLIVEKWWVKELKWDGQHYWEVGIKGKGKRKIRKIVSKYFNIVRDYHVPGFTYHWFVIVDVV